MTEKPQVSIITPVRARSEREVVWLAEAIESVVNQTMKNWELVLVNDHSTANLSSLKELLTNPRIRGFKVDGRGVAVARNFAASHANAELLFPLDGDDLLSERCLEFALDAWKAEGHKHGIVYGDTMIFGQDFSRYFKSVAYHFDVLMHQLILPVGALFRKSDWKRVGGWKAEMEAGLEDWEFWIAMGEIGVCGHYIPEMLYQYRKNMNGRLATLRADPQRYHAAYQKIRDLHKDVYGGRKPMGCCGGGTSRRRQAAAKSRAAQRRAQRAQPDATIIPEVTGPKQIMYVGGRRGGFGLRGRSSGISYTVKGTNELVVGPNGTPGVDEKDVRFLLSLNRGRDFEVV